MMNSVFDPLTLFLIAAVVLIFWRFRAVLGKRTGFEKPPVDFGRSQSQDNRQPSGPVIENEPQTAPPETPVWQGHANENSELAKALQAIASKSSGFNANTFLAGANLAYEMILEAYAKGDIKSLKPLLARDVFDSFSASIAERNKLGNREAFQFVGMKSNKYRSASLTGNIAAITVELVAQIIGSTTDSAGNLVDGDHKAIRETRDVWTFERDVTSKDPNWKLAGTESDG